MTPEHLVIELGERVLGHLKAENLGPYLLRWKKVAWRAQPRIYRRPVKKERIRLAHRYANACKEKKHFELEHVLKVVALQRTKYLQNVEPYLCDFCNTWHVGHIIGEPRRLQRSSSG